MIDLNTTPLVFVDVETTGFSPTKCRMIEVAAIRVEDGMIISKVVSLLKLDDVLPPFITKLTGITTEDLKDAPPFADIAPQLESILQDAVFIAHNAQFDYSFFKAEFERIGQKFSVPSLCTVDLSRCYYPQEKSHKLAEIIVRHGFDFEERHRAYDDAAVLIQFFNKIRDDFGLDRLQTEAKQLTKAAA